MAHFLKILKLTWAMRNKFGDEISGVRLNLWFFLIFVLYMFLDNVQFD